MVVAPHSTEAVSFPVARLQLHLRKDFLHVLKDRIITASEKGVRYLLRGIRPSGSLQKRYLTPFVVPNLLVTSGLTCNLNDCIWWFLESVEMRTRRPVH